jgi:hypothetical protein
VWWIIPVIPTIQEERQKITSLRQAQTKVVMRSYSKIKTKGLGAWFKW